MATQSGQPESLPPTSHALQFHLMRVHYQALIMRNSHCPEPNLPSPDSMTGSVLLQDFSLNSCHLVVLSQMHVWKSSPVHVAPSAEASVASVVKLTCLALQC